MTDINFNDIKKAYLLKIAAKPITLCYSGKKVNVKGIKIKDKKEFLKVLESENEENIDTFIDKLIEKYCFDDDDNLIDASKLIEQERQQILIEIRKNSTESDTAKVDHVCPACNKLNTGIDFNFSNITQVEYKENAEVSNTISSKNGNVKFELGFLNRRDNIDIIKYIKDKGIESQIEKDFIYLASTVKQLYVSLDDVTRKYNPSVSERVDFVENLTFDDFEKIKGYFAKVQDFGVKLGFDFECKMCGHKAKEEVKFVDFFIK